MSGGSLWFNQVMANTNEAETSLTPKQERFCQLFATHRDYFGNGTQSYCEAYNVENDQNSRQSASQLLTKPHILKRINELMDYHGLNDVSVDRELAWVIAQKADFGAKVAAIREYNKLRQRITERTEALVSQTNVNLDGGEVPDDVAQSVVDEFVNKVKSSST